MGQRKKQFAVIGLGRFGGSVCQELHARGHDVLAIDKDEKKVAEHVEFSTQAVQMDATDEKALKGIGIGNFENVIVAIGEDIQTSILTTLALKELNVARVRVKAQNQYHQKVLEKIGADQVIQPEFDMGKKLAQHLASDKIVDYIELSPDYSIVELSATAKIHEKTLDQLDIRSSYGITILAIKRNTTLNVAPKPNDQLYAGDILTVLGTNTDIQRFDEAGL